MVGTGDKRPRYSTFQRSCHWSIAALCVLEFPTAAGIHRGHLGRVFGIQATAWDYSLAAAHEGGGWLILTLSAALAVSRLGRSAPSLPSDMPVWQRLSAYAVHTAMYGGLVALVASGVVAMHADGRVGFLHTTLAKIGVALIAIHVAAALWHQIVRRDGLLAGMLPWRKTH